MATNAQKRDLQNELNRMNPAADHAKLGNIINDLITQHNALAAAIASGTYVVSPATLVIKAGASAVVKSSSAFSALVGGVVANKAADTDMSAIAGTLATAKSALWAFYINAAGTISTSTKTADAADAATALALMPATPAGSVRIGYIIVTNATGSNFVGGTTALDTANLTVVYTNEVNPASAAAVTTLTNR